MVLQIQIFPYVHLPKYDHQIELQCLCLQDPWFQQILPLNGRYLWLHQEDALHLGSLFCPKMINIGKFVKLYVYFVIII